MTPNLAVHQLGKLQKKAGQAAKTLKSLSNKWRLMILCQLLGGEKSVGELLATFDLSQSALSQHLAVLRKQGLVATRRESQSIYYSIKGQETPVILGALYNVYCATPEPPPKRRRSQPAAGAAEP